VKGGVSFRLIGVLKLPTRERQAEVAADYCFDAIASRIDASSRPAAPSLSALSGSELGRVRSSRALGKAGLFRPRRRQFSLRAIGLA